MLANPLKSPHPLWLLLGFSALVAGLWLVFWPPTGSAAWVGVGTPLLGCGSALVALQLVLWRTTGLERAAAPAEINAWVMLLFLCATLAALLSSMDALAAGLLGGLTKQLAVKLGVLVIFYVVLAQVLRARRGATVLEDERDREISRFAAGWGRGALIFCIIGLVVVLGFSPQHKLEWATPTVIASQLMFALIWGWICEYAATAVYYWRDRQ